MSCRLLSCHPGQARLQAERRSGTQEKCAKGTKILLAGLTWFLAGSRLSGRYAPFTGMTVGKEVER